MSHNSIDVPSRFRSALPMLAVAFALTVSLGCQKAEESPGWYDAMVIATDHLDHGRWKQAEEHLLRSKKLVTSDDELWETLDRLGALYSETDRYEEAEKAWRESLSIVERLYEKGHVNIGTALNNLAVFKLETGETDEAQRLFKRVVAIYKKQFGVNHDHTEAAVLNLAVSLHRQGKLDEAESSYEEAVKIAKAVHGENSPNAAMNYFHYGLFQREKGELDAAERLIRKATELRAELYGPYHEKVAVGWNWLISVQEENERYDAARESHTELLKLRRELSGGNSESYAAQLNSFGLFLDRIGRHQDAKGRYLRALKILIRADKENDDEGFIEDVAWNYGESLLSTGDDLTRVEEVLRDLGLESSAADRVIENLREYQGEDAEEDTGR